MRGKELKVCVPSYLRCPILLDLMKDPVTLSTGITYDRHSIETWLDGGNNLCPVTNQALQNQDLIPNHTLRRLIQDWCVANRGSGIERIPTPTVPVNSAQIADILLEISSGQTEVAIKKLRVLAKESNRNRKCISSTNAPSVVAGVFCEHSLKAMRKLQPSVEICEEALGILAMTVPLSDEPRRSLTSFNALRCITFILRQGNPEGKSNAVLLLQEMATDREYRERIGATDGLAEGLVQVLREPICAAATKASITTICRIAASGKRIGEKVVEAGAVPLLLEILPEADRGICERALAALNVLCNCTDGRAAAYEHALTMPLIVKKMLRISQTATEFALSVLWTICRNYASESVLLEALQVGAFDKLVVLVQLGCTGKTRERATDLLKLLSKYRGDWECADTMGLKEVKI
eukprot:Gb_02635 [translate_table: standard]